MIPLPFASGLTYLILGYGLSGRAAAAALKAGGATVLVWDDSDAARQAATADGFAIVSHTALAKHKVESLICAPGIPLEHPAPHPMIRAAKKAGVPILSDLDLLFKAQPKARYVGVTGTNGKSTTTALIAHILKSAGQKVEMGGNIGVPALALEPLGEEGTYVLELSSYQLDLIQTNPLSVGVLLNITTDHIDHHGSMEGYSAAKKKIARHDAPQTIVIGTDEKETQTLFGEMVALNNLTIYELSLAHQVIQGIRAEGGKLSASFAPHPIDIGKIQTLPGAHNAQNAAAAWAACHALGLSAAEVEKGLQSFAGLAHRQQLVATIGGVRFINDSKATNADAAAKALVCYDSLYWIIGGRPKSGGLSGLEPFLKTVEHAFIIGEASADFAAWCKGKLPFTCCGTLDIAVQKAATMAWADGKKDATVLLSPACASFDQYARFEERGEHFATLARALTPPAGN